MKSVLGFDFLNEFCYNAALEQNTYPNWIFKFPTWKPQEENTENMRWAVEAVCSTFSNAYNIFSSKLILP